MYKNIVHPSNHRVIKMQSVTNFKNNNNVNIVIENILNNIIDGVNRSNHSSGYYLRKIHRINYDNEDENCDDINDLDYEEYKFDRQTNSRPQRFQRVDYSDMMLNDEDDYDVTIRKRRFENGKIVYNCEKIKASQIDAKFDDDYVIENDKEDDNDLENMLNDAELDDPNDEDYVYESAGEDEFDDDFNDEEEDSDDDVSQEDEEESDNEKDEDYVYESDKDDEEEVVNDNNNDVDNMLDAAQLDDPNDEDYVYESDEDDEFDEDFDDEEESDDEASDEEDDREDYDDDEDYVYESDEEDELEYNYDFLGKKPTFSRAIKAN